MLHHSPVTSMRLACVWMVTLGMHWLQGQGGTVVQACTTFAVTSGASSDGSVFAAHTNDWGSDPSPGKLQLIQAADYELPANRSTSGGSIPQVSHTFKYFTEGYGAVNEHQVGVAESTCASKAFPDAPANQGVLNIVDLSKIVLERTSSAREGVETMGALAEQYGYKDAAESLLVVDSTEVWVFQIFEGPAAVGALWAAQRVPDGSIAAVTNAFTIRDVDFDDTENFLVSQTIDLRDAAADAGWWTEGEPFDFTKVFADGTGPQYGEGRRMWRIYSLLAPETPLSPTYDDYVLDAPYPTTVATSNVTRADAFGVMRDFYNGTDYALNAGMAGGYYGAPDRWSGGSGYSEVTGAWERAISLYRSQVSFVLQLRSSLPAGIGGLCHFTTNAGHSGTYVPLAVGMSALPAAVTNGTSWGATERWSIAWGVRYLNQILQIRFDFMYQAFSTAREAFEADTDALLAQLEASYTGPGDVAQLDELLGERAAQAVDWLWAQSDALVVAFANNGGKGYPAWWLESEEVGYEEGPVRA